MWSARDMIPRDLLPEMSLITIQPRSGDITSLCVRYGHRGPARAVYSRTMVNRHSREAAAKDERRYEDLESRSGSSCERLIARSFRGVSGRTWDPPFHESRLHIEDR